MSGSYFYMPLVWPSFFTAVFFIVMHIHNWRHGRHDRSTGLGGCQPAPDPLEGKNPGNPQ